MCSPEGGTITGVTTASGSGLTGGGTSGTLNLALTNSCATNQVLQWNGTSWVCAAVGTGTITGVTAGTDLTGGGPSGNVTLNLDTTKVPQLVANNSFTGNQSVTGNVSATGTVSSGVVNATTSFSLGGNAFAFGSFSSANAFLGFAGNSKTTSQYNTAAGAYALYSNTTGPANTAAGFLALQYNTTGAANTASGADALSGNTTGGFNTASGYFALGGNSTGSYNTATGVQALAANTASGNTASGYQALAANTTGPFNMASGYQALAANTTGGYNTAGGYQALVSTTSGSENTAVGFQALAANTTGYQNTASGTFAGFSNTTAAFNTASGNGALYSNTMGSYNTAIGTSALDTYTSGNDNTALGYSAGAYGTGLTQGSNNTFVGAYTNSALQPNLTNATAVGASAQVTTSNALVLGSINGVNGATADALVGIGTTAPTYKLHVGTINNGLRVEGPPMGGSGMVSASFGGNGDVGIDAPGAVNGRFVVKDTTGYVGIGTASPANTLEVGSGGTTLADSWNTRSSRRWKTNIQTLHGALDKVEQLRGVSYDLKETGKHEVGVIAEEVGAVVPEIVSWEKNGKDAQGVDYSRLTALLIEATKEQQILIRKQHWQIETQQTQIETQQTKMKAQQAQIARLASEVRTIQVSMKHGSNAGGAKVHTAQAQMATVHQ